MGIFLHGRQRKLGIVTLVMACLCMGLWLRSQISADSFSFPYGNFLSINGGLLYEMTSENAGDHWWNAYCYTSDFEFIDPYNDSENMLSWRWRLVGFGIAIYDLNRFSATGPLSAQDELLQRIVIRIPYWSIVIPLTLLSAWLLLSKPRVANPA